MAQREMGHLSLCHFISPPLTVSPFAPTPLAGPAGQVGPTSPDIPLASLRCASRRTCLCCLLVALFGRPMGFGFSLHMPVYFECRVFGLRLSMHFGCHVFSKHIAPKTQTTKHCFVASPVFLCCTCHSKGRFCHVTPCTFQDGHDGVPVESTE